MQHLFIINPTAGKVDSSDMLKQQIAALDLADPCTVVLTKAPGDATEQVRRFVSSTDDFVRIYACGGDGTLNEVVCGAAGLKNCAVGVVPVGSGNDFIKSFDGFTRENFLDLAAMTEGDTKVIDLLRVGDRYSINVVSCGYDCAVGKNMVKFKDWPLVSGSMAYKLSLIYCLGKYFISKFRLIADGVPIEDKTDSYIFAVAGNGQYYGGGFRAAPYAVCDDGLIDFVRITKMSHIAFFRYVGIYKRGEHIEKMKTATLLRCKELQICADKPVDMNIDGEIVSMENPVIRIEEHALQVILPKVKEAATV